MQYPDTTDLDARHDYLTAQIEQTERFLAELRAEKGKIEDLFRTEIETGVIAVSPYLRKGEAA